MILFLNSWKLLSQVLLEEFIYIAKKKGKWPCKCWLKNDCQLSKYLLFLKTSSPRLQCNNFTSSKTFWRRLEDVLEDEKLLRWRRLEDVLKTCLEDLLKILWRQTKYLLGISVYLSRDLTNLNVYLTSLYFTNLYLTILKRIQNALIRTQ